MNIVKLGLLASALMVSAPASAAQYLFDIGIGGTSGSGSLTTQGDAAAGLTLVQSLTGTFGGASMTLLAPGSFPEAEGEENDNLLTATSPFFTFRGLSFSAGGANYNIWSAGNELRGCIVGNCSQSASFSLSAVSGAVPEPGTWAMMLLGFGFVGAAMRSARRRQTVTVTYV